MKILMVTRELGDEKRYGIGKSLTPLCSQFEAHGVASAYVSQADAGERSLRWLRRAHRLAARWLSPFFGATDIAALIGAILERLNMGRVAAMIAARGGYTHVHCHDPIIAAGYRWFARLYRVKRSVVWGVTEHGFGSYIQAFHEDGVKLGSCMMRLLRRWERRILLAADWVICPTQGSLRQLARDLALPAAPSNWHAIYHPRPALNRYARDEARARLSWQPDALYVLGVGRFIALKDFSTLIRACGRVQSADLRLVLLGEGDALELQRAAEQAGLADRFECLSTDDIALYYSAADIYASASHTESFGLANLEAMSQGLPAICTAVGGVPEVVGDSAILVPAGDEGAMAAALRRLAGSFRRRRELAAAGRLRAAAWPDAKQIASAYLAVYEGRTPENRGIEIDNLAESGSGPLPGAAAIPKAIALPEEAKILVLAPHPDDEALGCAGALTLLRENRCQVRVVVVTDGGKGDPFAYSQGAVVEVRKAETRRALSLLGIEDVVFLDQPDGGLELSASLLERLKGLLVEFKPDWIMAPSFLDYHKDHSVVGLSAWKAWKAGGRCGRLFFYEIWQPAPANCIVDISAVIHVKKRLIEQYVLPLKYCNYLDAFMGLARYRGLYLPGATGYAEAFLEVVPETADAMVELLSDLLALQTGGLKN